MEYSYGIGMNQVEVLGPVFLKSDGHCSEVELFRYATTVYQGKRVDNIIHVRMEETSETFGQNETAAMAAATKKNAYIEASAKNRESTVYSCKSSALAVTYNAISPDQAENWFKIVETLGTTSEKSSVEKSESKDNSDNSAAVSAAATNSEPAASANGY